jgi:heme-degrading monooxygenase HmoA
MGDLYTCGTWTVIAGREDDFVAAWQDLADWTAAEIAGASWANLVQHQEKPNVFLSFGPWESPESIAAWRESEGFRERVGRIRDLLEAFEPGTYELRASVGR